MASEKKRLSGNTSLITQYHSPLLAVDTSAFFTSPGKQTCGTTPPPQPAWALTMPPESTRWEILEQAQLSWCTERRMSNYYYMMAVITILHSTCPVIPQDVVIFVKCFAPGFPHLRSSCMQTIHRGGESKRKKKDWQISLLPWEKCLTCWYRWSHLQFAQWNISQVSGWNNIFTY